LETSTTNDSILVYCNVLLRVITPGITTGASDKHAAFICKVELGYHTKLKIEKVSSLLRQLQKFRDSVVTPSSEQKGRLEVDFEAGGGTLLQNTDYCPSRFMVF